MYTSKREQANAQRALRTAYRTKGVDPYNTSVPVMRNLRRNLQRSEATANRQLARQ